MERERRRSPRISVEPLAYINLGPDNSGIILNLSEDGLCFHSTGALEPTATIHFWFWVRNRRIEGDGELAWTDESQKKAGLHFTSLASETREQIRSWIMQSAVPIPAVESRSAVLAADAEFTASRPEIYLAPRRRPFHPDGRRSRGLGFSAGVLTGLVISGLIAAGVVLHNYRSQVGESLIRLGEHLAPSVHSPQIAQTQPSPVLTEPGAKPLLKKKDVPPPKMSPAQADSRESVHTEPIADRTIAVKPSKPLHPAVPAPPIQLPGSVVADKFPTLPNGAVTVTLTEAAKTGGQASSHVSDDPVRQMFFELGKYKHRPRASQTMEELAQLGFQATVVEKNHLWKNYYSVVVGPYTHDAEADSANKTLLAHGFNAQPVERGSRSFDLRSGLKLNETSMPSGAYTISWESYVTHTRVKFLQDGNVVATVEAQWMKSDVSHVNNAIVYRVNPDGSRTLLQIIFAGMQRALVLGKAS